MSQKSTCCMNRILNVTFMVKVLYRCTSNPRWRSHTHEWWARSSGPLPVVNYGQFPVPLARLPREVGKNDACVVIIWRMEILPSVFALAVPAYGWDSSFVSKRRAAYSKSSFDVDVRLKFIIRTERVLQLLLLLIGGEEGGACFSGSYLKMFSSVSPPLWRSHTLV